MKLANVSSCVLALAFAGVPVAFAAEADTAPAQDVSKIKTLDEVIVTGRLTTLSGVKKAMLLAEDRFYERFNELNTDRNLDIRCRYLAPTGSRIKRRTCVMVIVDDLTHEQAMQFTTGQPATVGAQSPAQLQRTTLPILTEKTLALLKTDPDLLRALLEHARLQQIYDQMNKEKHKKHFAVWD